MRTTLVLLLAGEVALVVVLASTVTYDPKEWVMVPDANYTMYPVRISELKAAKQLAKRVNFSVYFYLFTKENANSPQKITTGDETALKKSNFNPKNPTRFLIHGYTQKKPHQKPSPFTKIRDQYLSVGHYNIFIVDWNDGCSLIYFTAAYNTLHAGKKIGAFIRFLIAKGKLEANDTYIAGFSLGAHVAGITGKTAKLQKINTIFGLDPALPLFTDAKPRERLTKEDALYVETIHTNAGRYGLKGPIGVASFYPNYGSHQPGCSFLGDITGCSHSLAYAYFAESITSRNSFRAVQCSSYRDIARRKCHPTKITLHMGGEPSNYGHSYPGVYYLKTAVGKNLSSYYSDDDALAL